MEKKFAKKKSFKLIFLVKLLRLFFLFWLLNKYKSVILNILDERLI